MAIRVRAATGTDAARLSALAASTFRETFEQDNDPQDLAQYLAQAFSADRQTAEIADSASTVLLAECPLEPEVEMIGYVHLVASPVPRAVRGPAPLELKRLYVSRQWHGQGVAQALMNAALDAARARGARTMWLGVWERNPRALAFYAKYGFTRVGEHTFMLGSDSQTDWLLVRSL